MPYVVYCSCAVCSLQYSAVLCSNFSLGFWRFLPHLLDQGCFARRAAKKSEDFQPTGTHPPSHHPPFPGALPTTTYRTVPPTPQSAVKSPTPSHALPHTTTTSSSATITTRPPSGSVDAVMVDKAGIGGQQWQDLQLQCV